MRKVVPQRLSRRNGGDHQDPGLVREARFSAVPEKEFRSPVPERNFGGQGFGRVLRNLVRKDRTFAIVRVSPRVEHCARHALGER